MKRSIMTLGLAAVMGLALVACSSGDSDDSSSTGAASDIAVKTLDTFAYEPNAFTATAGGQVNLTLDNSAGALEHSWVVLNQGVTTEQAATVPNEGGDDMKFYAAHVPAGQTYTNSFTAPAEAGSYVVVCTIAGHAAGGMLGTLTVN